uniref:Uncharacterized protein n=1 Tax=Glossina palpalis gambiensis TaxID=67801 RepID=A0A1B0BER3_9MUSC
MDEIAVTINRQLNMVSNCLKDSDNYVCIKHSGPIPTTDQTTKRHIRHLATNENMNWMEANAVLGLNVSKQRVQQVLNDYGS